MDPTQEAFLVDLVIYATAALVTFLLGYATGRAGKRKAVRRAEDRTWRMSETLRRHQS